VDGYLEEAHVGLPFAFAFLVLPIILHRASRDALPRQIRTRMHAWLQSHEELRVTFAARARDMVPVTRHALLFGAQHRFLSFSPEGAVARGPQALARSGWPSDPEMNAYWKQAHFLGRWLTRAGTPTTTYVLWGIRP
jgi:hypothetical protein